MEAWVYLFLQLTIIIDSSGLHYPVGSSLWDMNEEIIECPKQQLKAQMLKASKTHLLHHTIIQYSKKLHKIKKRPN